MNRRKKGSSLWYIAALALLLCIAFFVTATGTAFARYRSEIKSGFSLKQSEAEKIVIGSVITDVDGESEKFIRKEPVWKVNGSVAETEVAVSNGGFGKKQEVSIRLIAGTGFIASEEEAVKVKLSVPDEENPEEMDYIVGSAEKTAPGTALYHTHGEAWIIRFFDENGNEYSCILENGEDKFVKFAISVEGGFTEDVIVYPMAVAEIIE